MTSLETLCRAFLAGEVLAAVGIADELEDMDPDWVTAQLARKYANQIVYEKKWGDVYMAVNQMANEVIKPLMPQEETKP